MKPNKSKRIPFHKWLELNYVEYFPTLEYAKTALVIAGTDEHIIKRAKLDYENGNGKWSDLTSQELLRMERDSKTGEMQDD